MSSGQSVPVGEAAKVNILDVSLDTNRQAVDNLLAGDCSVFYVDHHLPGESLADDRRPLHCLD
jgi:hypothetical protein